MKLIVDISDNLYNVIKSDEYGLHKGKMYDIIRDGTPFDSVKAEFIKLYPKNYMGEPSFGGMFCNFSLCTVLEILDNIGKKSEEKQNE